MARRKARRGPRFAVASRKTFFQDEQRTIRQYRYPQERTYLAWRPGPPDAGIAHALRTASEAGEANSDTTRHGPSRFWLTVGGTVSVVRRDCQTCERDYPHRRGAGVLLGVGHRVQERLDAGVELFRMRAATTQGEFEATHVLWDTSVSTAHPLGCIGRPRMPARASGSQPC